MKQNWEFKNKSLHFWLFISDKGVKDTQWGKKVVSYQMVFGQLDIYIQKMNLDLWTAFKQHNEQRFSKWSENGS